MHSLFPEPVRKLPEAQLPYDGAEAYLLQGAGQQVLFMAFDEDIPLPEHRHRAQWGIVLEGRIDLTIDGVSHSFTKGDRYFIPEGVPHWGKIHKGYVDITFFDQPDRFSPKEPVLRE